VGRNKQSVWREEGLSMFLVLKEVEWVAVKAE
jgi:hypothetical protein